MEIFLKLRNNILLESDLLLAEKEVNKLFGTVIPIDCSNISVIKKIPVENIISNIKKSGTIGYLVSNNLVNFDRIIRLLSFVQEIWSDNPIQTVDYSAYGIQSDSCGWCAIPLMAMSELLFFCEGNDAGKARNIVSTLAGVGQEDKDVVRSLKRVKTSAPHIHSFHTYKAKFFPRFVRSLIVSNCDIHSDNIKICDPFVGSGTTLIESAIMGFSSCGIDLDPLSCFISDVKSQALYLTEEELSRNEGNIHADKSHSYEFPDEIAKKFKRWGKMDEMKAYQNEISMILDKIASMHYPYNELYKIALSDALTRKFNIRMLGTGSGRFSLEVGKKSLSSIVQSDVINEIKAIKTVNTLKEIYNLKIEKPTILNENAVHRSISDKSVDIIVTSPPYIPASSGREDYFIGKLIAYKAVGSNNENEMQFYLANSVGSMDAESDDLSSLPLSVINLYNWLKQDELRCVKARPVIAYYRSLIEVLKEDLRTIKDDGKIIYIIGKETVFYNASTKDILYKVHCDDIFIEIAASVGLVINEVINIELDKKDNIARPRGFDKYYECAIVMSKNKFAPQNGIISIKGL